MTTGRTYLFSLFLLTGAVGAAMWPERTHAQTAITAEAVQAKSAEVQERGIEAPLSGEIPGIPGSRDEGRKLFVNKENVEAFRHLLLAPLAAWIEADLLVLRLVRSLDYRWDYGADWDQATVKNLTGYNLDARFSMTTSLEKPGGGFPFGVADDIAEIDDPAVKARMILWNLTYAQAAAGDIVYEGELSWVGSQTLLRRSDARFFRKPNTSAFAAPEKPVLRPAVTEETAPATEAQPVEQTAGKESPQSVEPERSPPQFSAPGDLLWQEMLRISSPPVVFGYAEVSWRFRGIEDDWVWIYSPVIGKSREVLASNRSDALLDGTLTMDDFFVWSTKVQSVNARVVDEKVLLVPFPAIGYYEAEPVRGAPAVPQAVGEIQVPVEPPASSANALLSVRGLHERLDGTRTMALWNHETHQFPRFAPWVPTSVVFVPREVWILELTPRDPYYSTGREVLIVDKRSMLPVYKIVYDVSGEFSRIVIGAWAMAEAKQTHLRRPFAGLLLSIDRDARRATTFTPTFVHFLDTAAGAPEKPGLQKDLERMLDIRTHGTVEQQKPEPPKIVTSTTTAVAVPAAPAFPSVPQVQQAPKAPPPAPIVQEEFSD